MTGFLAFFRKEMLEQVRTHRLLIILVAFLLVGLASPLLAKYTPELLGSLASDDMRGMEIVLLADPDATDALFQYQKNFMLIPLLVILLTFGTISAERSRGIAAMELVKPVSRSSWVLAKAAVPAVLLSAATVLSGAGAWLYTTVLFGEIDLGGFILVNALLLLNVLAYLAISLFGSALTSSQAVSAGIAIGGFLLLGVAGAVPVVSTWSPAGLSVAVSDLVMGREPLALGRSVVATAIFIALLLATSIGVVRRQELA